MSTMSVDSYLHPLFPMFYDFMVEDLTRKNILGEPDAELYAELLLQASQGHAKARWLDLATGTGRVIWEVVDHVRSSTILGQRFSL